VKARILNGHPGLIIFERAFKSLNLFTKFFSFHSTLLVLVEAVEPEELVLRCYKNTVSITGTLVDTKIIRQTSCTSSIERQSDSGKCAGGGGPSDG
jgi:hypothetical protein